jgi:2-methylcitrate dehydratase
VSEVQDLAQFVNRATYEDLSEAVRRQLKIRILDALGCAVAAIEGMPLQVLRNNIAEFNPSGPCTLIGGSTTSPEAAAFYNAALIRYWDSNDSYLAGGDSCHPSDNLGAVLAAAEYADLTGRDLLLALAIAYQVECRLCDAARLRDRGFDEPTYGAYSVASGVSKALDLGPEQIANALAMCGASFNALRVTSAGRLSQWKSLAFANMSSGCVRLVFLARGGITGPDAVLEGDKGFMDAIAGAFEIDWSREDLERVKRTIVKAYDANVKSQTAIEGVLDLKQRYAVSADDVERVDIDVFELAYHVAGGGDESRYASEVESIEQAHQSIPYVTAAALLDGELTPAQYTLERIRRTDVQQLLKRVAVHPNQAYTERYPTEMPCRVRVRLRDGRSYTKEVRDYPGFVSQPVSWETIVRKFDRLSEPYAPEPLRRDIAEAVDNLDELPVRRLMLLLAGVGANLRDTGSKHYA